MTNRLADQGASLRWQSCAGHGGLQAMVGKGLAKQPRLRKRRVAGFDFKVISPVAVQR